MDRFETDLESVAEAFDNKVTFCGSKAYAASAFWGYTEQAPNPESLPRAEDLIGLCSLSADLPLDVFERLFAAFFWDFARNLTADEAAQLAGEILGAALIEQAAETVSKYRDSEGETPTDKAIEGQLLNFSNTAFEYRDALKRRCGDVKPLAGVLWNGTAGRIGCSALSPQNISPAEWAQAMRAFLLLPLLDGSLSEDDVRGIFQDAYDMLMQDKEALEAKDQPEQ